MPLREELARTLTRPVNVASVLGNSTWPRKTKTFFSQWPRRFVAQSVASTREGLTHIASMQADPNTAAPVGEPASPTRSLPGSPLSRRPSSAGSLTLLETPPLLRRPSFVHGYTTACLDLPALGEWAVENQTPPPQQQQLPQPLPAENDPAHVAITATVAVTAAKAVPTAAPVPPMQLLQGATRTLLMS
jgi:hypothetical protein